MNKVTIDRALIEQAIDTFGYYAPVCGDSKRMQIALRAALAEPVVEPYAWVVTGTGLFRIGPERPFDDDVWQPVYTSPTQPAEHGCKFPMCQTEEYQQMLAAQVARELIGVPLLSDEEILQLTPLWFKKYTDGVLLGHARAIEQLVRRKAGL